MSKYITLKLSSDTETGIPVSNASTGDRFTTTFIPAITLDPNKRWSVIPVFSQVYHSVPNISVARANNKFTYTAGPGAAPNDGTFELTIADGLYSLNDLQETLASLMVANLHGTILSPIFTFTGLSAEGKINLGITNVDFSINFNIVDSLRELLGFAADIIGPSAVAPTTYKGTTKANMSQGVEAIVIHLSIVTDSYSADGRTGDGFSTIPLNKIQPNRQAVLLNNLFTSELRLSSNLISQVDAYLTDQAGRRVSLNGSVWSITFMIREAI